MTFSRFTSFWFRPVDARICAVFRMAYSAAALINLSDVWAKRHQFYADGGFIDHALTASYNRDIGIFSVFGYFHSAESATWICLLAGLFMIFLGVGFLTRISAIAVFLFTLSYMNYNPLMLAGWDSILVIYAWIMVFAPLSGTWSVDSQIRRRLWNREPATTLPVYGLKMMQIQSLIIYISVALLRCANPDWQSGDHLLYFMFSAYFRFSGEWIFAVEGLLRFLNYVITVMELAVPILLLFYRTRWLGFLIGYSLHLALLITTNIWLFQICMLIIYIPFVKDFEELKEIFTLQRLRRLLLARNR